MFQKFEKNKIVYKVRNLRKKKSEIRRDTAMSHKKKRKKKKSSERFFLYLIIPIFFIYMHFFIGKVNIFNLITLYTINSFFFF